MTIWWSSNNHALSWAMQPLSQSLDDLVRAQQKRLRDRHPERLCRFEIDYQLELRGLLDGKYAWLRALEDLVDVGGDAAIEFGNHRPIGHQAPGSRHVSPLVYRRDPLLGRRLGDQKVLAVEAREGGDEHGFDLRFAQGGERRTVAVGAGHIADEELDPPGLGDLSQLVGQLA